MSLVVGKDLVALTVLRIHCALTFRGFGAGGTIRQHFGPLTLYRIRETTTLREDGGISRFVQTFISEVRCQGWRQIENSPVVIFVAYPTSTSNVPPQLIPLHPASLMTPSF